MRIESVGYIEYHIKVYAYFKGLVVVVVVVVVVSTSVRAEGGGAPLICVPSAEDLFGG